MAFQAKEETLAEIDNGSALNLPRSVVESLAATETESLRQRLQILAKLLVQLPGIQGAAIIAFDEEGSPLTSGTCSLCLRDDSSELEILLELQKSIEHQLVDGVWLTVDSSSICRDEMGSFQALLFRRGDRRVGLVLAAVSAEGAEESLQKIAETGPFLASALRSCLQQEAWTRIEQLQELARTTLAREPWDFQGMVDKLSIFFEAGAVTMLLNEQGELRLSASTDSNLSERGEVIYRPGEGITGHVFQSGRALRLSNTKDREEVFRITGLDQSGPRFSERDQEGSRTVQFLGVPMRFGDKIVGVLRMSRRKGVARFTPEDEKALQFFADLLGVAVAPARDLLLGRSMLDSVTEAIVISRWARDSEGRFISRIIMANPGAAKLLGRDRQEIEGLDAEEIYPPGEYKRIRQALRSARGIARREGYAEYGPVLSKIKRLDKTQVFVTISYRLLANRLVQPPIFYTIGLARETSAAELKAEQHQRLLELLGAMKIAYFRDDLNGITLASTSADSEITGYSPEEFQVTPRTLLYPEPFTRNHLLNRARDNRGDLPRVLVQMKRKNGELFWGEGDLRILKDERGRETGSEGLYRDVTDRILLQGFINAERGRVLTDSELFTKLEKDAELQLDYLSSLSHQLQTPLGSLIETLRNFERGEISQRDLQQRLPYVIGQVMVCTRLVRNLSYMDKILRGESFEKERVPLAKLAIETKLDFLHLLEEKKLDIRIDDDSLERHVPIQGHQEMLRQVLVNLVDNAIKYSLPNTTITIRGRTQSERNFLEISNQGLPLSAEDREKIFQRGFRTRGAQAVVPHGTGLGLWLVRKIVEAHGATIHCLEVLEGGEKRTIFRILFPTPAASPRRSS
jgi:PAS domain S-box-containing protein